MLQQTFADGSFEKFRKKTRKELFLDDMDLSIPWQDLCGAIKPFYRKPEGAGRRPVGIERMLRIHFLQHRFDLSDPGAEEALYDSRAMRTFVGIDLGREPVPDESTQADQRKYSTYQMTYVVELFTVVHSAPSSLIWRLKKHPEKECYWNFQAIRGLPSETFGSLFCSR